MIDIEAIDSNKPINNIHSCCTTSCTATYSHLLVKENFDGLLTISNIEEKFDEKFDDITYYTLGNNVIVGA